MQNSPKEPIRYFAKISKKQNKKNYEIEKKIGR